MKVIAFTAVFAALVFAQPAVAADGKTVYGQTCAACHASVVKGKGAMPPKAGNASLTEEDIGAAIDYMLEQVK